MTPDGTNEARDFKLPLNYSQVSDSGVDIGRNKKIRPWNLSQSLVELRVEPEVVILPAVSLEGVPWQYS